MGLGFSISKYEFGGGYYSVHQSLSSGIALSQIDLLVQGHPSLGEQYYVTSVEDDSTRCKLRTLLQIHGTPISPPPRLAALAASEVPS